MKYTHSTFSLFFLWLTRSLKAVISVITSSEIDVAQHYLGPLDKECPYCRALHWSAEAVSKDRYGECCLHRKVVLPFVQRLLRLLHRLYNENDFRAKEF